MEYSYVPYAEIAWMKKQMLRVMQRNGENKHKIPKNDHLDKSWILPKTD